MGGSARKERTVTRTVPYTAQRQVEAAAARAWLASWEVSAWLAGVAADMPDHALTEHVHITVEWK